MDVEEVVDHILSFLDDPMDLVSVACTARRYVHLALRILWAVPPLDSTPLRHMAQLFPADVRERLFEGEDPSMRIPVEAFGRFDYYARFVRHLRLWQLEGEAVLATILTASRPGIWLFPSLRSIHLGLDGERLFLVRPYLTPTLTRIRIDHWESHAPFNVAPTPHVISALLDILRLPDIVHLDLMDTRYSIFEHHAEVVNAFVTLAPRLHTFISYDFTTHRLVFDALSSNPKLTDLFLELTRPVPTHVSVPEISTGLRTAFFSLRKLTLQSDVDTASELLHTITRPLHSLDIRVDGPLNVDGLHALIKSIRPTSPSLKSFRCSSSYSGPEDGDAHLRDALRPLAVMHDLQVIRIALSFRGEHMISDADMVEFFASWPDLRYFSLESDPDERPILTKDDPVGYGITLASLVKAVRPHTPHMRELYLSYVDTSVIPDIAGRTDLRTHVPLAMHLGRSHVHEGHTVAHFFSQLWPMGQLSFDHCCLDSPSDSS